MIVYNAPEIILYGLILIAIGALVLGRWPVMPGDLIGIWLPVALAIGVAISLDVPFWRDRPFGDAFDIGTLVYWALCLSGRWAHGSPRRPEMRLTNGKMHVTDTPWGPLEVRQVSKSQFAVQYGKQVKSNLTYAEAANELGIYMMHWAQCEGAWRS